MTMSTVSTLLLFLVCIQAMKKAQHDTNIPSRTGYLLQSGADKSKPTFIRKWFVNPNDISSLNSSKQVLTPEPIPAFRFVKEKTERMKMTFQSSENAEDSVMEGPMTSTWGGTSYPLIKKLCNVTGPRSICHKHGASMCYCQGGLADCSGRPYRPRISYAPRLPMGVKCLIFRHNHVQHFDDSFFHNVSDFEVIDFSYNELLSVSRLTFKIFQGKLKYLILNYNVDLKYKYIRRVLDYPPSLRLDLINMRLKGSEMPIQFFAPYANISTQEFHFDLNFFPHLDLRQFAVLKHVKFLSFTNSSIVNVTSAPLPLVTGLDLNNNAILQFPDTCHDNSSGSSLFPKLEMLYLNTNNISHFPAPSNRCLPSLVLLGLTRNNISVLESNSLIEFASLKVLYLDEMARRFTSIGSNTFSSKSLVSLHISNNKINFTSSSINSRLFQGCSRLEVLSASHNNMANVPSSRFVDILSIPSLKYLYLGSCRLQQVPSEGLSQLKSLRKLFLYDNMMTSLPVAAFDSLPSLQYLRLDKNLIEVVHDNVFSQATQDRLIEINLGANDFQCTCDLLWFRDWLVAAGANKFADYPDGYTCANIPQTMLIHFSISRQACYFSRNTYILFVVCLSIFLAGFLIFIILFRYRWHIRLAIYEWSARQRDVGQNDEGDYQYDVFIVYCNDDSDWVLNDLLVNIENHWGYKAFIHERDFLAGGSIFNNIVRAMNLSRRILVVLTSNFASSRWCNCELMLCQTHIIEHDLPSLLVLQLEPIPIRDMTAALIAIRNTTSFLEWPANPQDEQLFWKKLEHQMEAMRGRHRQQRVPAP